MPKGNITEKQSLLWFFYFLGLFGTLLVLHVVPQKLCLHLKILENKRVRIFTSLSKMFLHPSRFEILGQ